jgi:hypothetical protein
VALISFAANIFVFPEYFGCKIMLFCRNIQVILGKNDKVAHKVGWRGEIE